MRLRTKIVVYIFMFVLVLGSSNPMTPAAAQGRDLNIPVVNNPKYTIDTQPGNDAFFVPSKDAAVVDHDILSEDSNFQLSDTQEKDRNNLGTVSANTPYTLQNINRLYQASNVSSENLRVSAEARYYDLTLGESDLDSILNTVLFSGSQSGFRFEANVEPMVINLNLRGTGTFTLDIYLLDPSGEVWDYSDYFSNQFKTSVNVQIPFVPPMNGVYTLFLNPITDDVILQSLNIITSPDIIDITQGYSEHLQGTKSVTKFFKLTNQSPDTYGDVLQLDTSILQYTNPEILIDMDDLIGDVKILLHSRFFEPFGLPLPFLDIVEANATTWVSVSVTAPNDDNPVIKSTKDKYKIPEGFDVDYAFWSEKFEISELETNADFQLNDDDPNVIENFFYYNLSDSNTLLSLNSTGNSEAYFINRNDIQESFFLDSTANDILNSNNDDIVHLMPGEYFVSITDDTNEGQVRIEEILLQTTFDQGDTTTFFPSLDQPKFFRLDREYPGKEYFQFAYLDSDPNPNIELLLSLYDSEGMNQQASNPTFDTSYTFANTANDQLYSVNGGYFRMEMISNSLVPADTKPSIQVKRLEYNSYTASQNALYEFDSRDLLTYESLPLDTSLNTIVYVYNYTTNSIPTGYRILTTSENMTYQIVVFTEWNNVWFDDTANSATTIDGIDYYSNTIEFGTLNSTDIVVVVIVDATSSADDGNLEITLQKTDVTILPDLELGTISTVDYSTFENIISDFYQGDGSDNSILQNPLFYGGIAAVAVISGTAYFLWNKRQ